MKFIKEHWKGILFVLYLLSCLTLLIGGLGWTDYAKTPFWWKFWEIIPWVGGLGFVGGLWWFSRQKNVSW